MEKCAKTTWTGGLKTGKGAITTESGALTDVDFSFTTRFEESKGTNPEELIAAAHSACFSMALAHRLESEGLVPEKIQTSAAVTLSKQNSEWTISGVRLDTMVKIQGINQNHLNEIAKEVLETCPVSRVLRAPIDLSVRLEQAGESLQEAG